MRFIGAVLSDGIITNARRRDMGSGNIGIRTVTSEWDLRDAIINNEGYNEIHVYNPKIFGLYLKIKLTEDGSVKNYNLDQIHFGNFTWFRRSIKKAFNFTWKNNEYTDYQDVYQEAEKYNLKICGLINGKLYSLVYKDHKFYLGKEIKPKEIK